MHNSTKHVYSITSPSAIYGKTEEHGRLKKKNEFEWKTNPRFLVIYTYTSIYKTII